MIVQANRKVENVLPALGLVLDQCFFNLGHFLVQGLAGGGNNLGARIALESLVNSVDLLTQIADLVDGVIGLADFFTDLY